MDLIDNNDDPLDDKNGDALRRAKEINDLKELFNENQEYYLIFLAALTVFIARTVDELNLAESL